MADFMTEEPLGPDFQETYAESQQKSVKKFCEDLNPRNIKDKPFVALCQVFKRVGLGGSEGAEARADNGDRQFLNPEYVAYAKIYEDEGGNLQRFVEANDLDLADFIRYTIINREYLS